MSRSVRKPLQFGLGSLFWLTLAAAIVAWNGNLLGPVAIAVTVIVTARCFLKVQ